MSIIPGEAGQLHQRADTRSVGFSARQNQESNQKRSERGRLEANEGRFESADNDAVLRIVRELSEQNGCRQVYWKGPW